MSSRLHHCLGTLWYIEELDKVGEMSITPNGDVQVEYRDNDGNLRAQRWRPRDVVLIAADDPENYYTEKNGGDVGPRARLMGSMFRQ